MLPIVLTGCIDLAVNHKDNHIDRKEISPTRAEVYTMRGGLGGVFSKGMNRLEDTLENGHRVKASSTVWYKGRALSHAIIRNYQKHQTHPPIVLAGHSLGANSQIQVARQLNQAHIPVALLITVDAVLPDKVPPNVARVVNIYKPSFVPMFSGLTLHASDPKQTKVDNINISTLKETHANHLTIDSHPVVQKIMVTEVLSTLKQKPALKLHETS